MGFLDEIRKRNRKEEKTYDEETDGKIFFKRPSKNAPRKEGLVTQTKSSGKVKLILTLSALERTMINNFFDSRIPRDLKIMSRVRI